MVNNNIPCLLDKIILNLLNFFALLRAIFISMNILDEKIKKIAAEVAEKNNFFLIDFVARGNNNSRIFEIFIDGETNISADDCAEVSQGINSQIELMPDSGSIARLDVSSPGVDRPLKYLKQYPKHINRNFEVTYKTGENKRKLTARLTGINGEDLVFTSKEQEVSINFNNIIKAKVIISFS